MIVARDYGLCMRVFGRAQCDNPWLWPMCRDYMWLAGHSAIAHVFGLCAWTVEFAGPSAITHDFGLCVRIVCGWPGPVRQPTCFGLYAWTV